MHKGIISQAIRFFSLKNPAISDRLSEQISVCIRELFRRLSDFLVYKIRLYLVDYLSSFPDIPGYTRIYNLLSADVNIRILPDQNWLHFIGTISAGYFFSKYPDFFQIYPDFWD